MLYSCDLKTKDYINNNLDVDHIAKDYPIPIANI